MSRTLLAVLRGHSTPVNQVIVVGSKLTTSDVSGCIVIWSLGDPPKPTQRLETHPSSVVNLGSDGKGVATGGGNWSVRLQDMETGQLLGQLGEATTAWKVGFLRGGSLSLVVLREGRVMMEIWRIDE
jgi:hypothetical protein